MKTTLTIIICLLGFANPIQAQNPDDCVLPNQANIVFGVGQMTLGGFNFEIDITMDRFIFDFSHGSNLTFRNDALETGSTKDQGLAVNIPWTSGFGIGYRFTEWLNIRVEPKWHQFEIYYDSKTQTQFNQVKTYTTFTLGLGLYTEWRPFKNDDTALSGLMIAPNVRWWPNVSTTLKNDQFSYLNKFSGQMETLKARNIGMNNSPFFFNVSIGYAFEY